MSRIGRIVISIPVNVKVEVKDNVIVIEGPKGKLTRQISKGISADVAGGIISVKRADDTKKDRALHGLNRALIANMVKGVTDGYVIELEIQGVGFRAAVQGKILTMQLGYSHPCIFTMPEGVTVEVPKQTQVIIRGIDKERVGEIAAEVRAAYPPEPYKGKGVRYKGEYVKKKVGKAQATK
ncbi:MAG: 50S ribosomal protein L6 [Candidatus Omnitrophota bacterium]|jgi:large subunit ribosomal protein L6